MKNNTKIYFVSDAHLGIDDKYSSDYRERLLIKWLDKIRSDATEIVLAGDIFDFWFEYKHVVPAGFYKLISKLRELSDSGIKLTYFTGNHDMWIFKYLPKAIGAELVRGIQTREINGKKLYIGHGDGLGPYDKQYNFLKRIFSSKFFQFLFKTIHPEISFRIARKWSSTSRSKHKYPENIDYNEEWLVKYSKSVLETEPFDFFVFGHRHIPFQIKLNDQSNFTNLGDWLFNFSYAVFDGTQLELKFFDPDIEN
ncbi:MAG TPA: UDP-2,3-diacylglucosamine diphosphatase [Bacteroidales bacterium]|nr:UDP-2,3-diacylglucosamine diphosphatase [Bacteroidales bacterium]